MSPELLVENDHGITTVTLNRPKSLNALNHELRTAIAKTFTDLESDAATRVAILTGTGRAFCAGIDLKELSGETPAAGSGFSDFQMIEALHRFSRPIIGAINGHAITGGFELALACDFLIASADARFADTHARVGIVPGWGLSQKLPRLIGIARAKELSLTGNFVDAAQAERWGLVNRVVAADELLPTCRSLAEDILSCDPPSIVRYKQMIDQGFATTLAEGMAIEALAAREHLKGVTPDAVARRRAQVQERGRRQQ